jgi:DNA-binding response OmpR family regulator
VADVPDHIRAKLDAFFRSYVDLEAAMVEEYARDRQTPGKSERGGRCLKGPHSLVLDQENRTVRRDGVEGEVSFGGRTRPWELLCRLCQRHPRYYRTSDLHNDVWDDGTDEHNVSAHMHTVRSLLSHLLVEPVHHRARGYRLEEIPFGGKAASPRRARKKTERRRKSSS